MRLKDGDKMTVEGMEAKIAKRTEDTIQEYNKLPEAFRSEYGYGQWLDATRGGMLAWYKKEFQYLADYEFIVGGKPPKKSLWTKVKEWIRWMN